MILFIILATLFTCICLYYMNSSSLFAHDTATTVVASQGRPRPPPAHAHYAGPIGSGSGSAVVKPVAPAVPTTVYVTNQGQHKKPPHKNNPNPAVPTQNNPSNQIVPTQNNPSNPIVPSAPYVPPAAQIGNVIPTSNYIPTAPYVPPPPPVNVVDPQSQLPVNPVYTQPQGRPVVVKPRTSVRSLFGGNL